jgi:cytochrome c553
MSRQSVFASRWGIASIAVLAVAFAVAVMVGFIWLPGVQARDPTASLWETICRAAGVARPYQSAALPSEQTAFPTSVVVYTDMLGAADEQSIGRGGTLALNCTMCHGARGISTAGTPHLAGEPASSTYKQLRDYKSGHRKSAVMQPLVASLADQDLRDLARYYASLEREKPSGPPVGPETPRLVRNGDPMRNIGACAACHSPNVGRIATPTLDGMSYTYLYAQLLAFQSGARANDINRQMRNAVRSLTPQEIEALSRYYASR